jgi:hypothetical protein
MSKLVKIIAAIGLLGHTIAQGQSTLNIYPDSLIAPLNVNFTPGVFYVPKTASAVSDFMGNGIQQNSIRTHVIESALNNTSNLSDCLSLLSTVQTDLENLSFKCEKLIFIFEKMPAWLSSSSDGSPASLGWAVLNTRPPSDWDAWQTAVDSITSKIVNQFGISNAYFEIWNEPDLGSWSGTMDEYFTLYKRTYDGIKSANPNAKVGGPTVNFWANNIYWQPSYGHIPHSIADSSLIGQLLDSAVIWNKIPDFITWHNFNISYQEFANATDYVEQKLASLSLPNIPLIVSEWNAPSQIRDAPLATSFMLKAQIEFSKTSISNNTVAAWQDFSSGPTEFHSDFGLLTYGAIHKPAYYSILLSEKLKGTTCKMISSAPYDGIATVSNDTLYVAISNYCPPPLIEAINHTLYEGQFNINQLDSAGFIDIAGNDILQLDSIYKGLVPLPNSTPLHVAINNSIAIYQHYDSIATTQRQFNLTFHGYPGNYAGQLYVVDSTQNNMQYTYDSLLTAGHTRESAISTILPIQGLNYSDVLINNGEYIFSLQPNATCLLKIYLSEITSITDIARGVHGQTIYIDPKTEMEIVRFASHPEAKNSKIDATSLPAYQAVAEYLMKK